MGKRYLNNPMGCIHYHDPHAAKPRVMRDASIQAVVDRGGGTYPYDKRYSKVSLKGRFKEGLIYIRKYDKKFVSDTDYVARSRFF